MEKRSVARPYQASGDRRRHRAVQSCFPCRSRKLKCDKQRPCKTCQNAGRDCASDAPTRDEVNRGRRDPDKDSTRADARQLEIPLESIPPVSSTHLASHDRLSEALHVHSNLEIDQVGFADAFYEEIPGEFPLDLGVELGRMRIMERLGGYHQPRLIQQISAAIAVVQRRSNLKLPDDDEVVDITSMRTNPTTPSYLHPGSDYIAPSNGFFFSSGFNSVQNEHGFLNQEMCQDLLKYYWGTAHILCKCLHRSSFEKQWDTFWTCLARGLDPPSSIGAVVMAVLFSSTIATPELSLISNFGTHKSILLEKFKVATESALIRAKFIHTTRLETLQALVIYLISLCRGSQLSKEHVTLLSVTIGIAESMGLHRDPKLYNCSVGETHVRRILWHQLCFLDLRACEAHRPRPQIREDEFDTMIPPTVNDDALDQVLDSSTWTDTSFSIIKFECSVIHRIIWIARPKLERKEVNIPTVLGWIMDFRTRMLSKYAFLKKDVPIQRYSRLVLGVSTAKLFSMVLHRYHRAISGKLPKRMYQLLFDQIVLQLSHVLTLETSPELHPWSWHVGAWNMYRSAIILLEEVSVHPYMLNVEKIWRILDYIFLQPPGLTPDEKSIAILSKAKERLSIYSSLKKMKVPADLDSRTNQDTEPSQPSSIQSSISKALTNAQRNSHDTLHMDPTTISSRDTGEEYLGEFQYSSYLDMDIIEDIDWTRWNYMPSDDLYSIANL